MSNLYIMHYGVGHDKGGHSGRYPWGSGENPYGGKKKIYKRDMSNFVRGFDKITTQGMKTLDNSKAVQDYKYALGEMTKLWMNGTQRDAKSLAYLWKTNEDFRKDFVASLLDEETIIPSKNQKVKNIIKDARAEFNKQNQTAKKFVEDFASTYKIEDLFSDRYLKPGRDFVQGSSILKNSFSERGVLMQENRENWTDEQWLEDYLNGFFNI